MKADEIAQVLYIEDDERLGRRMTRELEHLLPEVRFRWVRTEEDAVALLRSSEVLLAALVDVDLGSGGDGLAAIERTRDWRPDLPVLVVTGLDDKKVELRAVAVRAMFVHKPLRPSEVEALLRQYLEPREDVRLAPYRRVVAGLAAEMEITPLEAEVLVWALDGQSRKVSGDRMSPKRSDEAVKDARRRIVQRVSCAHPVIDFEGVVELLRRRLLGR